MDDAEHLQRAAGEFHAYRLVKTAAEKKIKFFKEEKIPYFVSSIMAGVYVGICMIMIQVTAGMLDGFAGIKILQGISFAAALSLVIFAGSDLFTGNIFIITAGVYQKSVKPFDAVIICAYCYFGNLAGSILITSLFWGTGLLQGAVLEAVHNAALNKTEPFFWELFVRGILCNVLVCLAVWCSFRMQSETGKLIMIFFCIYIFIICGFEHSIANMTLFCMEIISGGTSLTKMLINLGAATAGNVLGGILLAFAYWVITKKALRQPV